MTCREVVEVVTDYLEGALCAEDRRRLEAHLDECPYCVTYVEQMRQVKETLGEITEDSVSVQTRADLLEAFRGWRDR